MVAIYIPVLQAPSPVNIHFNYETSTPNTHPSQPATTNINDSKITFFLRALHAHNKAKDNRTTCLGTAVTYGRRCRNPIYRSKWAVAVVEMIEAAEDSGLHLADLKGDAKQWAKDFACYLHGGQKGVAMACLGAVAAYRMAMDGRLGVRLEVGGAGYLPGVEGKDYGFVDGHLWTKGHVQEFQCTEESDDVGTEELMAEVKTEEQLRMVREKEMALLLANEERLSLLREKVLLLLERVELLVKIQVVKAEKEALLAD